LQPHFMTTHDNYIPIELCLDLDNRNVSLDVAEISKTANRILVETCEQIKKALSSIHNLRELAYFELPPPNDRSLLHEAWFAVDRTDAEKLLQNALPGSYLFRKDPYAGCLEEIIATARKERVKCYTLTYVDQKAQVHDKTIVQWKEHWMFYDDDPTLSGDYYFTFDELLTSLGSELKRPLFPAKIN
jgi:hypothetical protein